MSRYLKVTTAVTYACAAVAGCIFLLGDVLTALEPPNKLSGLAVLLLLAVIPMFFVFAYSRNLCASSSSARNRYFVTALPHIVAAAISTAVFAALSDWRNPFRWPNFFSDHSLLAFLVVLSVLAVFLVGAVMLLVRNSSTLATPALLLFWPYWLLLALFSIWRYFDYTATEAVFCFLCFIAPVLFAFAAGVLRERPTLAHAAVLSGLLGAPWIYSTAIKGNVLGNVWIMFNLPPDQFFGYAPVLYAGLTIASVALIAFAVLTAALRLLPSSWQMLRLPVSSRTWPACALTLIFLAIWFGRSVMPYRIPGAVDYGVHPGVRMLHIEKRGFQFHETSVSVLLDRRFRRSVSVSRNDRRLFHYKFTARGSTRELPEALTEPLETLVLSRRGTKPDESKPLRAWNAEGWYVYTERNGIKAYTTENGMTPPTEIVALFSDLQNVSGPPEIQWELRDVCLGFCYDPSAGLGFLSANHRCRSDNNNGFACK